MTTHYRHFDTKRPDGCYVTFERIFEHDPDASPDDYDCYDSERKRDWLCGLWSFVGIMARAHVEIVRNGSGTAYTLHSPGLWAVESDSSEDYLDEIYAEERATTLTDLAPLNPIVRGY